MVETTQMSINWQMDLKMFIHTMEYYLAIKGNEVPKHDTTWMNLKIVNTKWKKSLTKTYLLYDSIYMQCPENANL